MTILSRDLYSHLMLKVGNLAPFVKIKVPTRSMCAMSLLRIENRQCLISLLSFILSLNDGTLRRLTYSLENIGYIEQNVHAASYKDLKRCVRKVGGWGEGGISSTWNSLYGLWWIGRNVDGSAVDVQILLTLKLHMYCIAYTIHMMLLYTSILGTVQYSK